MLGAQQLLKWKTKGQTEARTEAYTKEQNIEKLINLNTQQITAKKKKKILIQTNISQHRKLEHTSRLVGHPLKKFACVLPASQNTFQRRKPHKKDY